MKNLVRQISKIGIAALIMLFLNTLSSVLAMNRSNAGDMITLGIHENDYSILDITISKKAPVKNLDGIFSGREMCYAFNGDVLDREKSLYSQGISNDIKDERILILAIDPSIAKDESSNEFVSLVRISEIDYRRTNCFHMDSLYSKETMKQSAALEDLRTFKKEFSNKKICSELSNQKEERKFLNKPLVIDFEPLKEPAEEPLPIPNCWSYFPKERPLFSYLPRTKGGSFKTNQVLK